MFSTLLVPATLTLLFAAPNVSTPAQTPFPNGVHCGASPGAFGDILPEDDGKPGTWVIGIDKVVLSSKTVGFVYDMKDGKRLLQATDDMPSGLLAALGAKPLQLRAIPRHLPARLKIVACPREELKVRQKRLSQR